MLAYFDRADPRRIAPELFVFTLMPLIELTPGSNFPEGIVGAGCFALARRFLTFASALVFALSRALAFVICFYLNLVPVAFKLNLSVRSP